MPDSHDVYEALVSQAPDIETDTERDPYYARYMEGAMRLVDKVPPGAVAGGFVLTEEGIFITIETKQGPEPVLICSPIVVRARSRDINGLDWALCLETVDPDGNQHPITIPQSMLYGSNAALHDLLSKHGVLIQPGQNSMPALVRYISQARVSSRVTHVQQVGWHDCVYVLPNQTYGATNGSEFQYCGPTRHANFAVSGSLHAWKENIGHYCVGNDNLVLAVCLALSSVLLKLTGGEPGGVHWYGPSSVGKSSMLLLAASLFGGGASGRLISWRLTDNGAEGVCAANNDGFVALDEIGQVDPKALYAMLYMFTNGQAKQRATREGGARATSVWRVMFASNGERSIVDVLRSGGQKPMAGQLTRVIDIPAVVDGGQGIFNHLHAFENGAEFSNYLKAACKVYHGAPARGFISAVAQSMETSTERAAELTGAFVEKYCPKGADGQVIRIAGRFGLFAAAGELAVEYGVLNWPVGESTRAAASIFLRYLNDRGTAGPAEMLMAASQVLKRIQTLSTKHFDELQRAPGGDHVVERSLERWGFRTASKDGPEYWITPDGWAALCDGFNARDVAREMVSQGLLEADSQGKTSVVRAILGQSKKARYYHLCLRDGGPEQEIQDAR